MRASPDALRSQTSECEICLRKPWSIAREKIPGSSGDIENSHSDGMEDVHPAYLSVHAT